MAKKIGNAEALQNTFNNMLNKESCLLVILIHNQWRGQVSIKPEDLGYSKEEFPSLYNLGRKWIYPKERLEELTNIYGRNLAFLRSIGVNFISQGWLVPYSKYAVYLEKYKDDIEDYNRQVDKLISEYEEGKKEIEPQLIEAAEAAFEKLNGKNLKTKKEFTTEFLDKVHAAYPTPAYIKSRCKLVHIPVDMGSVNVGNVESALSEAENGDVVAKFFNSMVLTTARETVEQWTQENLVAPLRAELVKVAEAVKEQVTKKGKIRKDTFESLLSKIERFKSLNVAGDRKVETMLDSIQKQYLNEDHEKIHGDVSEKFAEALGKMTDDITNMPSSSIASVAQSLGVRKVKKAKK